MRNKLLSVAKKKLTRYFSEFENDDILHIALSKRDMPFMFLAYSKDVPDTIIVSISADLTETYIVADIILSLIHVAKVELGESFLVTEEGEMLFGDCIDLRQHLFDKNDLAGMTAISQEKH